MQCSAWVGVCSASMRRSYCSEFANPQRLIEEDIEIISVSSKHYYSDWLLCCPVLLACPFLVNSPCREWPQTSALLPTLHFLCFLSPLPFPFFPSVICHCAQVTQASAALNLGWAACLLPFGPQIRLKLAHTDTDIHTNCRPGLCTHVTACCSAALPHAPTHKLGNVASLGFIWWITRYCYQDHLGMCLGSWRSLL